MWFFLSFILICHIFSMFGLEFFKKENPSWRYSWIISVKKEKENEEENSIRLKSDSKWISPHAALSLFKRDDFVEKSR